MQIKSFFALTAICTLQFVILYVKTNNSVKKKTVQLLSCMKKKTVTLHTLWQ